MNALAAAGRLLAQGYVPVPILTGKKRPIMDEWQKLRPTVDDLPQLFTNGYGNVGVLLGTPSGGLVDVDVDVPEARSLAAALLPKTGRVSGREQAPRTHYWYVSPDPGRLAKYKVPTNGVCLIELRGTGCQTVIHGQHPNGDRYRVDDGGAPSRVEWARLLQGVEQVAAGALLARHWPATGSRHDAALALAGFLLRRGQPVEDVEEFLTLIAEAAGDDDVTDRARAAPDTAQRLDAGEPVTGLPRLAELLGERVVEVAAGWLGLRERRPSAQRATGAERRATPRPLAPEALHGLVGEFWTVIEASTEAALVAVVVQLLAAFGNVLGRGAYFKVGSRTHYTNEFVMIVGLSSLGAKGDSLAPVRELLRLVDPEWSGSRVFHAANSSAGVIDLVRDPVFQFNRESNAEELVDEGCSDKRRRALFMLSEVASLIRKFEAKGDTLSATYRTAWDGEELENTSKTNRAKASVHHISMVAHSTPVELRRHLDLTEQVNGFLNRFLLVYSETSKDLPSPPDVPAAPHEALARRFRAAANFAATVGRMRRDPGAEVVWQSIYRDLKRPPCGTLEHLLAKGRGHVLRLSMLYALLDMSALVRVEHLLAAVALWDCVAQSYAYVFGDSTGDRDADRLLRAVREMGTPNHSELHGALGGNWRKPKYERVLGLLLDLGLLSVQVERTTGGRPATRYRALSQAAYRPLLPQAREATASHRQDAAPVPDSVCPECHSAAVEGAGVVCPECVVALRDGEVWDVEEEARS